MQVGRRHYDFASSESRDDVRFDAKNRRRIVVVKVEFQLAPSRGAQRDGHRPSPSARRYARRAARTLHIRDDGRSVRKRVEEAARHRRLEAVAIEVDDCSTFDRTARRRDAVQCEAVQYASFPSCVHADVSTRFAHVHGWVCDRDGRGGIFTSWRHSATHKRCGVSPTVAGGDYALCDGASTFGVLDDCGGNRV